MSIFSCFFRFLGTGIKTIYGADKVIRILSTDINTRTYKPEVKNRKKRKKKTTYPFRSIITSREKYKVPHIIANV